MEWRLITMTIDINNMIDSILESIGRVRFVKSDDIPNIDLYMDQVTTFMDKNLMNTARYKDEDKILTKTMINNYAKNNLLPAPNKKKYSKEHVIVLIFIYYYKNILSISDIQSLLGPLTDKYFGNNKDFSIVDIYDEVTKINDGEIEKLKKDLKEKYNLSTNSFENSDNEDREFLQLFSFICMLAFDVYTKKLLIEKLLDELNGKVLNKDDKKDSKKQSK